MSIDSSSGVFSTFNRGNDVFSRFRTENSADGQDIASLLDLGKNGSGKNLPGTNGLNDLFKTLDANSDGSLSSDEFSSLSSSSFTPQTFNSLLSLQENSTSSLAQKFVTAADTDKSGGVSVDELTSQAKTIGMSSDDISALSSMFSKVDTSSEEQPSTSRNCRTARCLAGKLSIAILSVVRTSTS